MVDDISSVSFLFSENAIDVTNTKFATQLQQMTC